MEPTILKGIYLFEDLTDEELAKISRILVNEKQPEGTFLFHEGDKGEKFYVILKGSVRISQAISGAGRGGAHDPGHGRLFRRDGPHRRLTAICRRYHARELRAFGYLKKGLRRASLFRQGDRLQDALGLRADAFASPSGDQRQDQSLPTHGR